MSDNQGERPADENSVTSSEQPALTKPPAHPVTPPSSGTPDAALPPRPPLPGPSGAYPVPPQQAPAQPQQTPAQPRPQGYTGQEGYAGQPSSYPSAYAGRPGAYPAGYAGQPPHTSAFGVPPRPGDAQPTLPIGGPAPAQSPVGTATAQPKKKSGAARVAGIIVAAALVGGAAGLGGAAVGVNLFAPTGSAPAAGPVTVTVNDTESVNQTTAIAAKVLPSVVTIAAVGSDGAGTGSGVVLTSDGYVVTNTHVVTLDGSTGDAQIRVTTSDGRVFDAEVVGTDPIYDLAVIKLVDAEDLTPIDFADSSALNVGDQTVAVGAPLGLANTVTTGIVSALNRSIEIASSAAPDSGGEDQGDQGDGEQGQTPPFFFDFGEGQAPQGQAAESIKIAVIQTDAAINPGNSGGALVDSEGKLIGINVAIASAGGSTGQAGSIGVGFAIPSDIVQRVTDEIIEDGSATHGLLGASVQSAAYVEGTSITGAYIAEIVSGGAAEAGGLQQGDIVTSFNGVPITDSVDLTAQVRAAAAGSDATVTFVRDGETQTVDVTLGELQ